ncbi:hypothetical protein [Fusobacterium varium]
MEKIIYIYNNNLELVAQPYVTSYEEFKTNPKNFYPDWQSEYYASLEKYNNPVLDKKTGEIREKTREELILLDNKLELLQDGEYVENGGIKVVEAPDNLIKKDWNKEAHIWEEGATREELIEERKNKILEYKKLKDDKKDLEESGFSSEEEILMLSEKMALLEVDINSLAEKIKGL